MGDKLLMISEVFKDATTSINMLPVAQNDVINLDGFITFNPESAFGTILMNTGGIIVDNLVRVYGTGDIDFYTRNSALKGFDMMIVADDAVGGLFAMQPDGSLSYFAPDTLEWEEMDIDYYTFLSWLCDRERVHKFYENCMQEGFAELIKNIKINEGILYTPPLWTESEETKREMSVVDIEEIYGLQLELYFVL